MGKHVEAVLQEMEARYRGRGEVYGHVHSLLDIETIRAALAADEAEAQEYRVPMSDADREQFNARLDACRAADEAEAVESTTFDPLRDTHPDTEAEVVAGLPMVLDSTVPEDELRLMRDGETVGRIVGLKIDPLRDIHPDTESEVGWPRCQSSLGGKLCVGIAGHVGQHRGEAGTWWESPSAPLYETLAAIGEAAPDGTFDGMSDSADESVWEWAERESVALFTCSPGIMVLAWPNHGPDAIHEDMPNPGAIADLRTALERLRERSNDEPE